MDNFFVDYLFDPFLRSNLTKKYEITMPIINTRIPIDISSARPPLLQEV